MTLIRSDEHGLYANVGGYKARPLPRNPHETNGYQHISGMNGRVFVFDGISRYKVGASPVASHWGGSPLVRVGDEIWWACEFTDATARVLEREKARIANLKTAKTAI